MKCSLFFVIFSLVIIHHISYTQQPLVQNIDIQKTGLNQLTVNYHAIAGNIPELHILLKIKKTTDPGISLNIGNLSGDIGYPITQGTRQIVWDYPDTLDLSLFQLQLIAYDDDTVNVAAMIERVDSNEIFQSLSDLVGIRNHISDPVHKEAVKNMIYEQFSANDIQPVIHNFGVYHNVIARKSGAISDSAVIIIDAHYDTVTDSPGADDNGSGMAGVLAAARLLKNEIFKNSIYFIAFDGEEAGLLGSINFLQASKKSYDQIKAVLNFEMIGYYSDVPNSQTIPFGFDILFPAATAEIIANDKKGNFITNVANDNSAALKNTFTDVAARYVPTLKVISLQTPGKGEFTPDLLRSDHAPFWNVNIPALMLTDGADYRNHNYHSAEDKITTINKSFMRHVSAAAIATLIQLAQPLNGTQKTISLSEVLSNAAIQQDINLNIYPQPAGKYIWIETNNELNGEYSISIFDLNGNIVIKNAAVHFQNGKSNGIDLQPLEAGSYVLKIAKDNIIRMQKIIKM